METKPGMGYPKQWEDQEKYKGGWILRGGKLELRIGGRISRLISIFYNPDLPTIDDYYEPWNYNYEALFNSEQSQTQPVAKPFSLISGKELRISWGPNWEDDLAGSPATALQDPNWRRLGEEVKLEYMNVFMFYLPRICNHCLNPSCVAACPSGAIYKREEDGIVLVDQEMCRGWRFCVSACPYKKVYFNWHTHKSEKCIFCYPRVEAGQPTVCALTCVGKIRYIGVLLYDADKVLDIAAEPDPRRLVRRFIDEVLLDPNDPRVVDAAREAGIPDSWIAAAKRSPVYKMVKLWRVAFPLHPEFRTLPMVFYVPPLSPVVTTFEKYYGARMEDIMPKVSELRIPIRYLANMFTAGDETLIESALKKLLAIRIYERSKNVVGLENKARTALTEAGLTEADAEEMYRLFALARYEDRFVIPASHKETLKPYEGRGMIGLPFHMGEEYVGYPARGGVRFRITENLKRT